MWELDPNGPAHAAECESVTYELHLRSDTHRKLLAAFDRERRLLWKAPLELGELLVREMTVVRDPLTNRLLLTCDGEHWRGGTRLTYRWLVANDGTVSEVFPYDAGALAGLTEAQRQAILTAVVLAASADGKMDPREIAAMRGLLDSETWGIRSDVLASDMQQAQVRARSVRAPAEVVELGRAVSDALRPSMRETLVRQLFAVAWSDNAVRPEEHWVLGAFMQGLGIGGERANELAELGANQNLFAAVLRGRIDVARRLLDTKFLVTARDPGGWTALHLAVSLGQAAIVDLLLERGADVHAKHGQGSAPLLLACNKPYPAIVERLLRAGASPDEAGGGGLTPLAVAAMFGQTAVARALRNGGATLERTDESGRTPLHAAAAEGHSGTVAYLLAEGAAADARTKNACTPLMFAAERGDPATVIALVAAKADIQAADIDRQTALHYATLGNCPEVVALLLSLGAHVDASSSKEVTPLHVAAGAGYTSTARLLLDAGAAVDAKNVEGGTPLFMAAVRDRREVYELLLARGANVDAPTSFGTTPRASIGAGLAIKSLRTVPFVEPATAGALRPDDAALAAHGDYQIAAWLNLEGAPDQVLVCGKDSKGRDQYVGRASAGELGARLLTVTDSAGKRWLPLFSSEAAADAFRRATPIGWPSDGVGLARAVMGSAEATMLAVGALPVEGVLLDPHGPRGPIRLTAEECERIVRRVRR